ncbi:MAG: helix-turn-helix transcriptional regulator [Arcobacteraceae bacterium]|jgi:DNA-binding XRE family transcriptional regulator|nr:helix-turn-helix transcriptional regulator [Arcobacteraceae bacterium]
MSRPTFEDFKKEAFLKPAVKEEYDKLAPEYELKMKLIKMRKEANLTQEEIATIMHTKRSNISRLESFSYNSSPNIATLMAYAQATGHQLKVDFV